MTGHRDGTNAIEATTDFKASSQSKRNYGRGKIALRTGELRLAVASMPACDASNAALIPAQNPSMAAKSRGRLPPSPAGRAAA